MRRKMDWSNDQTLEFLKLYERQPAIWNPKHSQHKNRAAVARSWEDIARAMSSRYGVRCTVDELKKKKESLMASFRHVASKVKRAEEDYRPGWFAYDAMARFLSNVYQPKVKPEEVVTELDDNFKEDEGDLGDDTFAEESNALELPSTATSYEENLAEKKTTKRRRSDVEKNEKQKSSGTCDSSNKDECALYAELLAKKLRKFDENTRYILMHQIDNLVFTTKMHQLNQVRTFLPTPSLKDCSFEQNSTHSDHST